MKIVIAALSVLALGAGAAVALEGPGRALVASETVLGFSNDAVLTGAAGNSIRRSFVPPYSGIVRVQWDVRSTDGTLVDSSAEVVHISSCSRQAASTGFVTKTCKLRVAGGAAITISAFPDSGTNVVELRNVRLYYRVVNSKGEPVIYELPEGD